MSAPVIVARGSRVIVRRKCRADAPDDYRWRSDPEVARYDGVEPLTISYADFVGLHVAELSYSDNRRQVFAIDTIEGQHIGNLMFYNASAETRQAELGVSIGEEAFRGKGYGTEALVAFVRFLWEEYPFGRLQLHTFEWNARARASFEHAGFQAVARVARGSDVLIRMVASRETWEPPAKDACDGGQQRDSGPSGDTSL